MYRSCLNHRLQQDDIKFFFTHTSYLRELVRERRFCGFHDNSNHLTDIHSYVLYHLSTGLPHEA